MNCQLPVSPFLYPILDTQFSTNVVVDAREVIRAGAKILQLRAKNQTKKWVYETIRQMVEEFDICLIVNDHVDVALVTEVAGVHLGQTDFPVTEAKLLLPDKIVGFSTHNAQQFETPVVADYIAVGPVFPTTSKENADPALGVLAVQKIIASKNKPVVAIGGILPEHIPSLIRAGVDGIAVISSLYKGGSVYDNTCKLMDRIHAQI